MQTFAKTLVHTGHVQYDEAASAEPLKFALQTYGELGIVRWARRTGEQGEQIVALELEPEYRGNEGDKFGELTRLTNAVASYRRCWREQDGPRRFSGLRGQNGLLVSALSHNGEEVHDFFRYSLPMSMCCAKLCEFVACFGWSLQAGRGTS
ncbi:unnamed protein product [Durusdinium trenchii]|uniref:Uncharacterized protein n=1 Tax=Durusdinium trenchii TaxID=1381693 RepID=A0ABP0IEA0_9DINO